ncbi:coiled-coil domain-containing protein [Acinetobacter sp. TSRC1-2]|uniref:coiled-coil domain-containing protein n=1 Tax=unclassified Acinetobacter TaxID=196816 RepID=UPI003CEEC160
MGKIRDMLSSGMTDGERKEVEEALRQLSALHGKLSAKYTLADNLEHITDGRTAASKMIKGEIEQLQADIQDAKALKNQLQSELDELLQLKLEISSLKDMIEYKYEDGFTTLQTLKELLDSDNLANLYNRADKLKEHYQSYFEATEGEELSYSQKLDKLSTKTKELYSYLFNNEVVIEGLETSREQAIKKKYQEIEKYYDYIFLDKTDKDGQALSSYSTMFNKQKASLDKFYVKIFGDEKNHSLENELDTRLTNLSSIEEQALKTINQASSAGLAGGFFDKVNQARESKKNNLWVFGISLFLLALFNFLTIEFDKLDQITITSIIVRVILNVPLIWIATVANINLNKYSKLEQEYGHKEALARSFEKYKSEIITLNAETDETIYLKTKLLDLNLEAFRKNPADGMETAKSDSFFEKMIPNIKKEKQET